MKKRILAFGLLCTILLGLFAACGQEPETETTAATEQAQALDGVFSVGYASIDVTPTESVPLDGYQGASSAQFRRSSTVEWPFSVVCLAATDTEGNTVMLITLDMLNAFMADGMRDAVSTKTGIPKSNIMFHCTHNHSGPALRSEDPAINTYLAMLTNGVLSAAETALNNRLPVTGMYTTYARPEGYNSDRHYLLADGSYQSYGVGSVPKDQLIGHFGVADNLLQLMKFTREGGRDVVMVNWQGHPPGTDPNTIATSNYPGVLRDYLSKNLNADAIFVLGGSGNLNNNSQIAGDIVHENYQELGQNLGATAVEAAANFTERKLDTIRISEKTLQLKERSGYGERKVWVYAISIGDFAFVTAPFEIFDDNAVAVRENSPYAMTMYVSCCNGSNGYLPTPYSFDWKITYEATNTSFVKGTAEVVQDALIGMLQEIATNSGYQPAEKGEGYCQPEFVPKTDGVNYLVPEPGNTGKYEAVENGFYAFQLFTPAGKQKNMLCNDEALVKQILEKTQVKLLFNEQSVVVGIAE